MNIVPLQEQEIPENVRGAYDFNSQRIEVEPGTGHGRLYITRTCLQCGKPERVLVHNTRTYARQQKLSGVCRFCATHAPSFSLKQSEPLREDEIPESSRAVYDFDSQRLDVIPSSEHKHMHITRTCRLCGKKDRVAISNIRQGKTLTGLCSHCSGLEKATQMHGTAAENSRRNGGRMRVAPGYIKVYAPDHPNAFQSYVMEHRLVMEQALGRLLTSAEQVHHRNGKRDDNRLENLELWTRNHGGGQRYDDLGIEELQVMIAHLQALLATKQAAAQETISVSKD